jgi:hypothetical protein
VVRTSPFAVENKRYLLANYSFSQLLLDSYDLVQISMTRTELDLVFSEATLLRVNNVTESSGQIIYGPLEIDFGYVIAVRACDQAAGDCVKSEDVLYSLGSLPPQELSDIQFTSVSSQLVGMEWKSPGQPNDYFVSYQVYRRLACDETTDAGGNETSADSCVIASGKEDSENKVIISKIK